MVDGDTEPAPENSITSDDNGVTYGEQGWDGIDDHKQRGNAKMEPKVIEDPHCPIGVIFFFHYFYS